MRKIFLAALVVFASCTPKAAVVTMDAIDAESKRIDSIIMDAMAVGGEIPQATVTAIDDAIDGLNKMRLGYIEANPDSEQAAEMFVKMNTTGSGNVVAQPEMFDTFDKFAPQMQMLPGMVKFKESMDAQKALEAKFGGKYIEIVSTAPDGSEVKLSEIVAANKLTLIDFWASWCGPCMRELPHLKEAYGEYHSKGFEVFGVTLDDDRAAWEAAIKDNEMNWIHVGSVAGWSEPAAVEYGVRSIPASWLVDGEGNIVARNLRGEELKKKVAEILK